MSSMYDKLEGLAQAAGKQAGAATDGDAIIGRVRRTRSVFRVGSAGVVAIAGLGLAFSGVAFANAASGGLANTINPGASISPSPSAAPSVTPIPEPSASPSVTPSPAPSVGDDVGDDHGIDGLDNDDCGDDHGTDGVDNDDCGDDHGTDGLVNEDADHQAGGDDYPAATDDSHSSDGGSTAPKPEPTEPSGDRDDS
jgi:hypothetical protein